MSGELNQFNKLNNLPFDKLVWCLRLFLMSKKELGWRDIDKHLPVTDRLPENSPTHTPNVDEESSANALTADLNAS
jgi:hypothetical protein